MSSLTVRLNRPQSRAFRAIRPNSTTCIPWGRGVGKSWFERFVVYTDIAAHASRWLFLLPTFKQAVDIHARAMESELVGQWSFLGPRINRTVWRVDFANGGWLQFVGAENAHGARGFRADGVVLDECDDIDPSVYDSVVQPWFSEPRSRNIRLLGGTPRRSRYGLLWRTHRRGTPDAPEYIGDHTSIHATAYDAPETVSVDAVERARRETPPAVFEREWLCSFDAGEGLVFGDVFDEHFHIKAPEPNTLFSEYLVGVDHGYEDPAVFLVAGVVGHGRDATVWILDEYYQSHRTLTDLKAHASSLLRLYPAARWYCDPSRPDTVEEYRRLGARIEKVNNAIDDGIAAVADKMFVRTARDGQRFARFYVHPRCHNLVRELGLYRRKRDPRNPDRVTEAVEDKHNHCFVAGTLVSTGSGCVPIENVKVGDLVWTRAGLCPVRASGMTRTAPVWRLELSNSRAIEATADHRIFTLEKGWVRLDELRYGLTVLECEKTCFQTQNVSCSTACHTGAIPTQSAENCAFTLFRNKAGVFIEPSGSTTSAPSPMGTTCTIETETRSTTTSATWNASQAASTLASTQRQRFGSARAKECQTFSSTRLRGIGPTPVELGTASTAKSSGPSASRLPGSVTSAAKTLSRWGGESLTDSAQTIASRPGAESPGSMTLTGRALSAAPCSEPTNTPAKKRARVSVVAVAPLGREQPVYCLGVDEHHEFFANGILVHNCIDSLRYLTLSRFGGPSRERHDAHDGEFGWG